MKLTGYLFPFPWCVIACVHLVEIDREETVEPSPATLPGHSWMPPTHSLWSVVPTVRGLARSFVLPWLFRWPLKMEGFKKKIVVVTILWLLWFQSQVSTNCCSSSAPVYNALLLCRALTRHAGIYKSLNLWNKSCNFVCYYGRNLILCMWHMQQFKQVRYPIFSYYGMQYSR